MQDAAIQMLLRGRTRLSASLLSQAARTQPEDAACRHSLALALRELGDLPGALSQAAAALSCARTPQGLALLGQLRHRSGDLSGAAAALQEALSSPLPPAVRARSQALLAGTPPPAVPLASELWGAVAAAPDDLAARIAQASCVVALTGTGITPASRRRQLWAQLHRDDAASIWRFQENPVYLWSVLSSMLDGASAKPGPAHRALAALPVAAVLTQEISGLHRLAGCPVVVDLHGSLSRTRCGECGASYRVPVQGYLGGPLPPRCVCGAAIRPAVLLCGEQPDAAVVADAVAWVRRADLILVAGCAVDIEPAASLLRGADSDTQVLELGTSAAETLAALARERR